MMIKNRALSDKTSLSGQGFVVCRMTKHSPFRYFKTSPEIIRLAVMLYVRFPLSLRNVEDLLHERGIEISHKTVRFWWNRFGPMSAEIRCRPLFSPQPFQSGMPALLVPQFQAEPCCCSRWVKSVYGRRGLGCASNPTRVLIGLIAPNAAI
jgi:putative transposase